MTTTTQLDDRPMAARVVASRAVSEWYRRYWALIHTHYQRRLKEADPRLPDTGECFHLASNWGNAAARRVLDQYHAACSRRHANQERDHQRAWYGTRPLKKRARVYKKGEDHE